MTMYSTPTSSSLSPFGSYIRASGRAASSFPSPASLVVEGIVSRDDR
jgi:hypothetical protein